MPEKFDVNKFWENANNDITPRYEIEGSVMDEHWTLYSYVETNFGGDAKNFICEGTLEYCEAVMQKLKVEYQHAILDEHSRLCQELENKIENGDNND